MTVTLLGLAIAMLTWPAGNAGRGRQLLGRPAAGAGRLAGSWTAHVLRHPVAVVGMATAAAAALSTALVAVLAGVLTALTVRALRRRRRDRLARSTVLSLAEVLGALAAELRAGRPLRAASETAVAACTDDAAARGLALGVRAAAGGDPPAGLTLDEPVREVVDRITAAVRLSTRTGCSLAAVLGALEEDVRARSRAADRLRAVTAGPRASALLLAGLPLAALAMGSGVGADPWQVLTQTPLGQLLLLAGVGLELAGVVWSDRLVRRALR